MVTVRGGGVGQSDTRLSLPLSTRDGLGQMNQTQKTALPVCHPPFRGPQLWQGCMPEPSGWCTPSLQTPSDFFPIHLCLLIGAGCSCERGCRLQLHLAILLSDSHTTTWRGRGRVAEWPHPPPPWPRAPPPAHQVQEACCGVARAQHARGHLGSELYVPVPVVRPVDLLLDVAKGCGVEHQHRQLRSRGWRRRGSGRGRQGTSEDGRGCRAAGVWEAVVGHAALA